MGRKARQISPRRFENQAWTVERVENESSRECTKDGHGHLGEGGKWVGWKEVKALLHASDHAEESCLDNRTAACVWLGACRQEFVFTDEQAYG
jgi:hypothetical protein